MATTAAASELSLKVMRLSRPFFVSSKINPLESTFSSLNGPIDKIPDQAHLSTTSKPLTSCLVENDLTKLNNSAITLWNQETPIDPFPVSFHSLAASTVSDIGLTEILRLPGSFGNIYLGETFSSYICINNESNVAVQQVGIKAELQTSSQRFTLADTTGTGPSGTSTPNPTGIAVSEMTSSPSVATRVSLLPAQSAEFIVHHEIKELGVHILVCSISYQVSGERKTFRKFYKFQVVNPLAVKTKVNTLPTGKVLLEAQVQNVTSTPMYLEQLKFEPFNLFKVTELNTLVKPSCATVSSPYKSTAQDSSPSTALFPELSTDCVFGENANYLYPQDTRQYLYQLEPKSASDLVTRSSPTLGKLDIIWRTALGQLGRLQTSQLSRKVPPIDSFELKLVSVPPLILCEEPFVGIFSVTNNMSEACNIAISGVKSKMSSVLLSGVSEKSLGRLEPRETKEFELHLFPLLTGLQKITGLKLTDVYSGYTKEIDHLTDIMVHHQ